MKSVFSALLLGCVLLTGCTVGQNNFACKSDSSGQLTGSINYENENEELIDCGNKGNVVVTTKMPEKAQPEVSLLADAAEEDSAEEQEEITWYVNEAVDKAVEDGKIEKVKSGDYRFSVKGAEKTYSSKLLEKSFDKLSAICSKADYKLSFSYKNMDSGVTIEYKSDTSYPTCSIIKAPYVKSLLANDVDLDKKLSLEKKWVNDFGYVAQQKYGTKFTVKKLIEYTIKESDNTAYQLLEEKLGWNDFNSNQYKIGADYWLGDGWIFTYADSNDMLKSYEDIYKFAKKDKLGKWLVELLADADENIQIGAALGDKYTVAQKYGADSESDCFHDCAICYADSPFVLCILTEGQKPETDESCEVFKELSYVFDDINSLLVNG